MVSKTKRARDMSFDISGDTDDYTPSKSRADRRADNEDHKKKKKKLSPARMEELEERERRAAQLQEEEAALRRLSKRKLKKVVQKKSNALISVDQLKLDPNRISKLPTKEAMTSLIGDNAEDIQQMLERGDSDSALTVLNKRLIQTCVDLIAEVEHGIRDSRGRYGVHSFNGLISSIRELMNDLQATRDRGAMGVNLVDKVIRPAMLDIGMEVMREYATMYSDAKDAGLSGEALDRLKERQVESRTRIGQSIQAKYNDMRDQTIQFLQR